MKKSIRKDFWSVVRIQKADINPGDRATWYCRIIRTDGKSFDDILCDGMNGH